MNNKIRAALEAADKATPGPWKFGGCAVWKWDGDILADLAFAHNTPTNTEANAILMTAAPDALDWIAKALPWMKDRKGDLSYQVAKMNACKDMGDFWSDRLKQTTAELAVLTALIAQAEGTEKEGE